MLAETIRASREGGRGRVMVSIRRRASSGVIHFCRVWRLRSWRQIQGRISRSGEGQVRLTCLCAHDRCGVRRLLVSGAARPLFAYSLVSSPRSSTDPVFAG